MIAIFEHIPLAISNNILFMLILLVLSGFFSAAETALFSLTRPDIRRLEQSRRIYDRMILKLRSDPQGLLATILFGNMIVNVLFFSLATVAAFAAAEQGAHDTAYAIGIGSLLAIIVIGEIVPKNIAVAIPSRLSGIAAPPILALHSILLPVRWLLGSLLRVTAAVSPKTRQAYVTPSELQILIRATGEHGLIPLTESEMMHEVMEFAEIQVSEVMVPRVNVVVFSVNAPIEQFRELVQQRHLIKVPIYDGFVDNIIGIVYSHEVLLSDSPDIRSHLRPVPLYVPEVARIESVLHQFREKACRFAIVVDEYGVWAGIITLEDIVEEIIGDIHDEYVTGHEPVQQIGPDAYVLSGEVSIRDWSQIFGIDLDLADVATLGGFLMLQLGRIPREGDQVRFANLVFTVQKVSRQRPVEIRIERASEEAGP